MGAQTHPGHTGFAWYRKHIEITGANKSLAVMIPAVDDTYELYWNGEKIGAYGKLPPRSSWWAFGHGAVYSLPWMPRECAWRARASGMESAAGVTTDTAKLGGLNAVPEVGDKAVLSLRAMEPRTSGSGDSCRAF